MEPLVLEEMLLGVWTVRELVGGVVAGDEVLDNGAGLEEGEVGVVGVGKSGGAAVGVVLHEFGGFDVDELGDFALIGKAELLEDDGDLDGIGATGCGGKLAEWRERGERGRTGGVEDEWLEFGGHGGCCF